MKKRTAKSIIVGAIIAAATALTLPAFAHPGNGKGNRHRTGGISNSPCNDGMIVLSPDTLWPPNHKLVTVDVAYIDNDNDGDPVSLTINSISSNQDSPDGTSECGPSSGPDWIVGPSPVTATDPTSASTTVQLRAERCGDEGSRIYTISVTCTDGAPENATARAQTVDVTVIVPHDQGRR
ncbi:MAG: hypothetical protein ACLQDV_02975 [Candidatus Binataceae bacterium]